MTKPPLTPLQPVYWAGLGTYQQAWIKRDDLNHPVIQGNKWHKLRFNIVAAQQAGCAGLLTFGGAYSNHIAATATAALAFNLKSIGIIRGDELANQQQAWSPTLNQAELQGMALHFVSRQQYRYRHDPEWLAQLHSQYPDYYFIPEGGSNDLAVSAMSDVVQQINQQCPDWTHLVCAVGTGATLAGLAKAAPDKQIWGIASLKQAEYLIPQIKAWIGQHQTNWRLLSQAGKVAFHGGGYGKTTLEIMATQQSFEQTHKLQLEPIYTAKLIYAFDTLLQQACFPEQSRIILYHSGGLQGRTSGSN
ncbi:1-aminocyclopropane-1-carboxylate deaminase/D-cysteine desulfhydrase [Thiomicrospira sp. ALE5]|uniref:1-aminocyclopropane-1-carboxylate deaminase/D-cysteine desulfhydrase n=1 Tax=Thiomicrospira sp. ALE5 TaxID=748650 RepID=UPI001F48938F|nr:pyridoxal-phosphate dependent enzyme [Thiomicrospira sp. ALE5]